MELFFIISMFIVFLIGFSFFLNAFASNDLLELFAFVIIGVALMCTGIFTIKSKMDNYKEKELVLLNYIVENNLTNKEIKSKFKNEIFEIKKQKEIQKLKNEILK